ncbi:STAS domain-containing protein [bacterium]|nr:STAS domain-containing protein [bacterium]
MSESTFFTTEETRGVTIVHLPDDYTSAYESTLVDLQGIPELARKIEPPRLIIDLRHVKYIGSAFIGFLISLSTQLQSRPNGRLALSGVAPFIRMALESTRSDLLFEIHDTLEEAIESLATY